MATFGTGMIVVGVLATITGVGGFVDGRKVDRRFKTGYKNNAPDTRNFGQAAKIALFGIGLCIVGAAVNSLSSQGSSTPQPMQVSDGTAQPDAGASDTALLPPGVVRLDPNAGQSAGASDTQAGSADAQPSTTTQATTDGASASAASSSSQAQTYPTSFDCTRASQDDETAICTDAGLAAMDRQLGQLYEASLQNNSETDELKQAESDWLVRRNLCDRDVECIRRAYNERIGQLTGSAGPSNGSASGGS